MRRITTLRAARVAACTSDVLGLAVSSVGLLGACSSAPRASDPTDATDASTVLDDAASVDVADADAADAALDAGPRLCSDDGFCPTIVPYGPVPDDPTVERARLRLRGVWGDGQGIVWATSREGDILRWDGTAWKIHFHVPEFVPDVGILYAIFGTGPTDVWVPTDTGLLHGKGDTSATLVFKRVKLPGDDSGIPVTSVWGTGPKDLWAVGGAFDGTGRALHYDGKWKVETVLPAHPISYQAIWGSAGSGPWIYGIDANQQNLILRRPAGTSVWKTVALQIDTLCAASLSSDDSVWLGAINALSDDGQYYLHGTKAADGDFDFTRTARFPWERLASAFWGTAPNDAWVVGQYGLVQHWNGTTWQSAAITNTPLPVVKSFYGIWGTSSTDFWIVGDEIALHKTTTGKP
jgi:hypothetical protein